MGGVDNDNDNDNDELVDGGCGSSQVLFISILPRILTRSAAGYSTLFCGNTCPDSASGMPGIALIPVINYYFLRYPGPMA